MHCCELMEERVGDGETAIVYASKFREYGIRVIDEGTSFIAIRFCPWCGTTLAPSLRNEWFQELDSSGFEAVSPDIPEAYQSDLWWNRKEAVPEETDAT